MINLPNIIARFPSRGSQFTDKASIRVAFVTLVLGLGATIAFSGCEKKGRSLDASGSDHPQIRIVVESSPATTNPRFTLDAIGQRLLVFSFRSLTRLDAALEPQGDLADSWQTENSGKTYRFRIPPGITDHAGNPITADLIRKCFENYLTGEPKSPHRASFPNWKSTEAKGEDLRIHLSHPDPYLPKNLTTLRYFTFAGDPDNPCREPRPDDRWITNAGYHPVPTYPTRIESEVRFRARTPDAPDLVFLIVKDETSRLFKLLNGDADVAMNSFSPTKTGWISKRAENDFHFVERDGTNASYLAFNLEDPVLSKLPVRQAIAHAIDREKIVRAKIRGGASVASSFLVSTLPESIPAQPFDFDPAVSEKLLDEAGYPRGPDGIRLRLKYKVSTNKTGLELAQIFREMLEKIGVALDLETVEPSVFFASIRKGHFQMYMSQWVGVSDGSIFHRTLRSGNPDNRVHYRNAEMDEWVDASLRELNFKKRKAVLEKIQKKMLQDLPYFPLWHWTNAIVLRKTIAAPKPSELSLSGGYAPFADLRFLK